MTFGRNQRSGLVDLTTDWGLAVSEAQGRKTTGMKWLSFAGWSGVAIGAFLVIPILAGSLLFSISPETFLEAGIVITLLGVGRYAQLQSRKGPKNALQIDYNAGEVRLGSVAPTGAFVRHKVCPLRSIDSVSVDSSAPDSPALRLEMFGETATIRFSQTETDRLTELAAKIQSAADEARAAPIRSRIVSRMNGFEANAREIGHRVKSRVTSSFA
ncbi:MAG: hypothetical protein HKO04_16115 [Silicimonas sp.]|nr:hypothetical protein [Silicimonas sp.]